MGKGRVIFYTLWFIFVLTWFVYSLFRGDTVQIILTSVLVVLTAITAYITIKNFRKKEE